MQHILTHGVDIAQTVFGPEAAETELPAEAVAVDEFDIVALRLQVQTQKGPQSGFAAAGGADHRQHLALFKRKADAAQHRRFAVVLVDVFYL